MEPLSAAVQNIDSHLFLLHIIRVMFGGVSDHLVLLLLINLI